METIVQYHEIIAALAARVFLGLLFFFQGYDVVFRIKVQNEIDAYRSSFEKQGIPKHFTVVGAWFTSYTELICGILLVLGLFQYPALYLLGMNVVIASIAFGINTPMWDTRHVLPRLILILFLLVIPPHWNAFSLDHLIFNIK